LSYDEIILTIATLAAIYFIIGFNN
jgi:hypothetical protein